MIKVTISVSICGVQQSRAHRSAQSLRFTTVQVLNGSQALISLIMVKNGSVSSASVQLTSSSSLSSLSSEANSGEITFIGVLKGACQDQSINVASRGSSQKAEWLRAHSTHSVVRSLSTVIASSPKIGFHPPFDLGVLLSLPLRDFGFSSLVIVIVKSYSDIFRKLVSAKKILKYFLSRTSSKYFEDKSSKYFEDFLSKRSRVNPQYLS